VITFNIPQLILGTLISCLIGSLIHLIFGGRPMRLLFAVFFAWIGFWLGDYFGKNYGIILMMYGSINLGASVILSLIGGFLGFWLSGENRPGDL